MGKVVDSRHPLNPCVAIHRCCCCRAGVGIVEKIGAGVTRVRVGDSVVMSYASCGGCNNCQSGSPSYCSSHRLVNFGGSRLDGSKTHHSLVPGEVIHGSYFRQSAFATKVRNDRRSRSRVHCAPTDVHVGVISVLAFSLPLSRRDVAVGGSLGPTRPLLRSGTSFLYHQSWD